jgi:hypothetical protein
MVICTGCEIKIPRKDFNKHNCIRFLKALVEEQGTKIEKLEEKFNSILDVIVSLKKESQSKAAVGHGG